MIKLLYNIAKDLPEYKKIVSYLNRQTCSVALTGLSDIHKCHIISSLCKLQGIKSVIICPDESDARNLYNDMIAMGINALIYPQRDFCFIDAQGKSKEYEHIRIGVLSKLVDKQFDAVITCPDASLQYTIPPEELISKRFILRRGQEISIRELENRLLLCGYENYPQVESHGQFSSRGGIVDFFPPNAKDPVRIEFFGDEIDALSFFDILSQRRTNSIDKISVMPSSEILVGDREKLCDDIKKLADNNNSSNQEKSKEILYREAEDIANGISISSIDKFIGLIYKNKSSLFNYIDDKTGIFISEDMKVRERLNSVCNQWKEDLDIWLSDGVLCKGLDDYSKDISYFSDKLENSLTFFMDTFPHNSHTLKVDEYINFDAQKLPPWRGSIETLKEDLNSILDDKTGCIILAGTTKYVQSVAWDIENMGVNVKTATDLNDINPRETVVAEGGLSSGFRYKNSKAVVISHGQIFIKKHKKHSAKKKKGQSIYDISELKEGNYIVHSSHGIGVFAGIHQLTMQGVSKDYIKLEYDKGDTLYVPVTQMDMISKYIGSRENMHVRLSRLGGTEWKKTKKRVRSAVKDIARELMKIYAERLKVPGYAFPEDDELQKDFEAKFEFDETEDQLASIEEIKSDMQKNSPMDRLLCGDVGFGKTEVALRAAFKCISSGKQCAMLVPTTILAWQHFQTIIKRFEGFPIKADILSRFRTSKQQEDIIRRLKRGEIDFVVGTHRLVQKDVAFRDLGLVIIDEEQRFGVAHKERFKAISKNVDVLTLSATPIPRTLNMAMSGIRDMSTLEEAPQDRYPVQTYVMEYDRGVVLEAIRKELKRNGQVYYLHNRVESIERVAEEIRSHISGATVGTAHGRMSESELSEVWRKMMEQEINVLVCTTIIETGIDLSNVNTLIIENADNMGLSQLHQIRGRVGRSPKRAYAYFTFRKNKTLSEIAQKRLSAIKDFTEFGAGFRISMRDLEIRGAGNIIGAEQHGNMEEVGYNMYLKLLGEAVKEEKGEKLPEYDAECLVDVQIQASIPEKYIKYPGQRIDIYRRISDIRNIDDALDVIDELIDRFGDIPKPVIGLINISLIRAVAASMGINEIKQQNNILLLYQKKFDMGLLSEFVKKMKGKATVNAGNKPYISVRIGKDDSPVQILNYLFNIKSIFNKQ